MAKALMNTPNANGVAWLLGQHKTDLGVKVVGEIRVFSVRKFWCMYFHVVDGPLEQA